MPLIFLIFLLEIKITHYQNFNEIGLVQLISLLPKSYPGHNIITDDLGELRGIDDCECGRKGKYFLVHGRIKKGRTKRV